LIAGRRARNFVPVASTMSSATVRSNIDLLDALKHGWAAEIKKKVQEGANINKHLVSCGGTDIALNLLLRKNE
jgi:hypothetical protein